VKRAVLVTGASRGIGRAVAQAFAELDDRVAVHHRGSPELARQVLAGLPGGGHTVVQADLADGASKAGLNSFGQSMARALAPLGIAVASVAPGYVETDMALDDLSSPRGDEIRAQSPFNRVATPQEIAAAVVYLASAEAEWASGAILDLNGASYLR
jgi:NAD(P)-dependent dehydrogenase (short-subunit alcohol dehydrogenase family)